MAKTYFHRIEWKKYRELCLEKAEFSCERCLHKGRLHIHHPDYKEGLKPWEYPIEFCEVLCQKCHAEIHGKIPPSGGWEILHSDLEDNQPSDIIPCDYCNTDIQWHFTIYHPDWGEMIVGSECAENLSLGIEVKKLKSYHRRMRTFIVSPRWVNTKKGLRITYQNYYVLIFRKGNKYQIKINNDWGKLQYNTQEEAKAQAFKVINHRIEKRA
ncbi:MAG: hypothetical protein SCH71_12570 [Desulfobulbaceae bacterium]|nr:hypothetical protein [Desulfobulbaceae bacterium]